MTGAPKPGPRLGRADGVDGVAPMREARPGLTSRVEESLAAMGLLDAVRPLRVRTPEPPGVPFGYFVAPASPTLPDASDEEPDAVEVAVRGRKAMSEHSVREILDLAEAELASAHAGPGDDESTAPFDGPLDRAAVLTRLAQARAQGQQAQALHRGATALERIGAALSRLAGPEPFQDAAVQDAEQAADADGPQGWVPPEGVGC